MLLPWHILQCKVKDYKLVYLDIKAYSIYLLYLVQSKNILLLTVFFFHLILIIYIWFKTISHKPNPDTVKFDRAGCEFPSGTTYYFESTLQIPKKLVLLRTIS